MSAAAQDPVTPGLSAARLDELVDKTQAAMDEVLDLLVLAVSEDGHHPGDQEEGPGPCVLCNEPWPCEVVTRAMKCDRSVKKALLALGVDRRVLEVDGFRHRPRPAE